MAAAQSDVAAVLSWAGLRCSEGRGRGRCCGAWCSVLGALRLALSAGTRRREGGI
jgi:hypothetical protein